MSLELDERDEISRCIIYDRAFQENIHTNALLWQFGQAQEDGASHESAVLRRLAPSIDDVHRVGCLIAQKQNERKNDPPRGPKRRYYCGFRTASLRSINTEGDGYQIVITNAPEFGEDAHVDVALFVRGEGRSERAQQKLEAGLALAECFGPTAVHICDCDEGDEYHPVPRFGAHCLEPPETGRWPTSHGL